MILLNGIAAGTFILMSMSAFEWHHRVCNFHFAYIFLESWLLYVFTLVFTYFVFQTINCMPLCAVHNKLYSEHGISERFYDISYAHRSFCYTRFIHVVGVFLALLRCDEMLADTDPIIMGKCVFFSHFYRAKTAKTDPSICAQASIFVQKKNTNTFIYTHREKP